jgi:hypothetical protein
MVMVIIITTIKMQKHICILGILLPYDLQFGTSRLSDNGWEQPPGLTPCILFIPHPQTKINKKLNMDQIFFIRQVFHMDSGSEAGNAIIEE